jgi:hypothetical protein
MLALISPIATRSLAVSAGLVLMTQGATSRLWARAGATACTYSNWSVLSTKAPNPFNAIAFTTVGTGPGTTYVLQTPLTYRNATPSLTAEKATRTNLHISTLSGRQLFIPQHPYFLFPRAVVDRNGDLNLVWAEPDSSAKVDAFEFAEDIPVSSIWYVKWRRGIPTQAAVIYRHHGITWNFLQSSDLVVDSEGGLHVAFPISVSEGGTVTVLNYVNNQWSSTTASPAAAPVYVSLAARSPELALAYVAAPNSGSAGGENGLYMLRSLDAGKSWSPRAEVADRSQIPAYEPNIRSGQHSKIHLVWTQHAPLSTETTALWHTSSRDTLRWSSRDRLPLNVQISRPSSIIDRCGTVHVVAQIITENGSKLGYTRFANGRWPPLVTLFPSRVGELPTLYIGQDADPYVLYYDAPLRPTAPDMYHPRIAHLKILRDR